MRVEFTSDEIKVLSEFLLCNPCEGECKMGYTQKSVNCYDMDANGEYRCKLLRLQRSIEKKLGL